MKRRASRTNSPQRKRKAAVRARRTTRRRPTHFKEVSREIRAIKKIRKKKTKPYKIVGYRYRSKKSGRLVRKPSKAGRKRIKREPIYFSLVTNEPISREKIRGTHIDQYLAEFFIPQSTKGIKRLMAEYKKASELERRLLRNRYTGLFKELEKTLDDGAFLNFVGATKADYEVFNARGLSGEDLFSEMVEGRYKKPRRKKAKNIPSRLRHGNRFRARIHDRNIRSARVRVPSRRKKKPR